MYSEMTKKNAEYFIWLKDKSWYRVNDREEIELTEKAPLVAVESFRMWEKRFK